MMSPDLVLLSRFSVCVQSEVVRESFIILCSPYILLRGYLLLGDGGGRQVKVILVQQGLRHGPTDVRLEAPHARHSAAAH